MKNILIILANPKTSSLSHSMAKIYTETKEEKGNSVDLIDLYTDEHQQGFYNLNEGMTKERKYYQNKISKADELVFIFPYWWGSMPAIIKNWLDWNFTSGFAYEYKNSMPVGLFTQKTATVFTTTGAPTFFYALTGANRRLKNMWKQQILNFCGMKVNSFNIFGGVNTANKDIEKILNKVEKIAST